MLTIHALPASEPVLTGVLRMHRLGRIKGRPVLTCQAWCRWCRDVHALEFPDPPFPLSAVQSLVAPCPAGPFAGGSVMVGLDLGRQAENAKVIRHHEQALQRWKTERRLACQFAEARGLEPRHLAEGWDVVAGVGGAT